MIGFLSNQHVTNGEEAAKEIRDEANNVIGFEMDSKSFDETEVAALDIRFA